MKDMKIGSVIYQDNKMADELKCALPFGKSNKGVQLCEKSAQNITALAKHVQSVHKGFPDSVICEKPHHSVSSDAVEAAIHGPEYNPEHKSYPPGHYIQEKKKKNKKN